jgi:hypothetical protein
MLRHDELFSSFPFCFLTQLAPLQVGTLSYVCSGNFEPFYQFQSISHITHPTCHCSLRLSRRALTRYPRPVHTHYNHALHSCLVITPHTLAPCPTHALYYTYSYTHAPCSTQAQDSSPTLTPRTVLTSHTLLTPRSRNLQFRRITWLGTHAPEKRMLAAYSSLPPAAPRASRKEGH